MVSIVLLNENKVADIHKAVIYISDTERQCRVYYKDGTSNAESIDALLANEGINFQHFLLRTDIASKINGEYCLQYQDMNAFSTVPRRFFSTLIKATSPSDGIRIQYTGEACGGKVNAVPFSSKSNQHAKEQLSLSQFEQFVRTRYHSQTFQYFEGVFLDEVLRVDSLPSLIDTVQLTSCSEPLQGFLNSPTIPRIEIRFISDRVGLGVFSVEEIEKGTPLFMYSGKLESKSVITSMYSFISNSDCFNREMNARDYGNFSRFMNHAPDSSIENIARANVACINSNFYGVDIKQFVSNKKIMKGDQLLFDYKAGYWKHCEPCFFKSVNNSLVINPRGKKIKESNVISLSVMRDMAYSGCRSAKMKVFVRPLVSFLVLLGMSYLLNQWG